MTYHNKEKQEVLQELNVQEATGLSSSEVKKRREQYGENRLRAKKSKSNWERFAEQFKDVMILILLAAAAISFVVACVEGDPEGFFEPLLILLIVVVNAIMGVMQESRAEKALEALKSMSAPHARVLRDKAESIIDASELVPGDIIRLEAGDFVPADARLLQSVSLKSEESALTGESVPAEKDAGACPKADAPLGDRSNMVFSGCSITYGTAVAVVTATGMDTEMGKIANLLEGADDGQTPLQKRLAQLGKYLGILALAACAIIFVVGLANGLEVMEIFMTSVSLAVSAIPEGLPVIVTIVLSIGVQRMVKKNALIRRLPAVETLGSASVICSDKTGTLTQNRMTLVETYLDGETQANKLETKPSEEVKTLLRLGTLCCDGAVVFDGDKEQHIGDPTETAIVLAAHKNGMPKESLAKQYPRLAELPFDSDRKRMTVVCRMDGKLIAIVKGGFDVMEPLCTSGNLSQARLVMEEMSERALRVLAVAYKEIDKIPDEKSMMTLEGDLHFCGLVGMIDPPRPEAKAAVARCRKAGIKPVMITGDHVVTARAIATQIGIYEDGDLSIEGYELDKMSEEELDEKLPHISVYARVAPEHKIRIVKAWQKRGDIVAMTGDGVNDAPALKQSDIGVAMGITGTEVSKDAASMILTDDNFSTIVKAVITGRNVYRNIKNSINYLLSGNFAGILCVFIASLLLLPTPFFPVHLLFMNLITDSLPAIAIGMETGKNGVLKEKPRSSSDSILNKQTVLQITFEGIIIAICTMCAYLFGLKQDPLVASTMAFATICLARLLHGFNCRSNLPLTKIGFYTNRSSIYAFLIGFSLLHVILFVPFMHSLFMIQTISITQLFVIYAFALIPTIIIQTKKYWSSVKINK